MNREANYFETTTRYDSALHLIYLFSHSTISIAFESIYFTLVLEMMMMKKLYCARANEQRKEKCENKYLAEHSWIVKHTQGWRHLGRSKQIKFCFSSPLSSVNIKIIIVIRCWTVSPARLYRLSSDDENCVLNLVSMTISIHTINPKQFYASCAKQFETASINTPQHCVEQHICVRCSYSSRRKEDEALHHG